MNEPNALREIIVRVILDTWDGNPQTVGQLLRVVYDSARWKFAHDFQSDGIRDECTICGAFGAGHLTPVKSFLYDTLTLQLLDVIGDISPIRGWLKRNGGLSHITEVAGPPNLYRIEARNGQVAIYSSITNGFSPHAVAPQGGSE